VNEVRAGIVYLVIAGAIGFWWLSGRGAAGVDAVRGAIEGRPSQRLASFRFGGTPSLGGGFQGGAR
jgi:hypothetical protein